MKQHSMIHTRSWSADELALIERIARKGPPEFFEMEADHHARLREALAGNIKILQDLRGKHHLKDITPEMASLLIPDEFEKWTKQQQEKKAQADQEYENTRKQLNQALREGMLPKAVTAEKRAVAPVTMTLFYDMKLAPSWVNVEQQTLRGDSFRHQGKPITETNPIKMVGNLSRTLYNRMKFVRSAFMYYNLFLGDDARILNVHRGEIILDRRDELIKYLSNCVA